MLQACIEHVLLTAAPQLITSFLHTHNMVYKASRKHIVQVLNPPIHRATVGTATATSTCTTQGPTNLPKSQQKQSCSSFVAKLGRALFYLYKLNATQAKQSDRGLERPDCCFRLSLYEATAAFRRQHQHQSQRGRCQRIANSDLPLLLSPEAGKPPQLFLASHRNFCGTCVAAAGPRFKRRRCSDTAKLASMTLACPEIDTSLPREIAELTAVHIDLEHEDKEAFMCRVHFNLALQVSCLPASAEKA
mmetsp:Transcript_23783/g.42511  ORF Transcript_23783/g.42511 Transcript_23783/m.42511 type:complete len:247 (-) Transcript_23783:516-1256(-)